MVIFHSYVNVYQRVTVGFSGDHDVAEEKEAALKREREEALKRAENEMTDLERRGESGQNWHGVHGFWNYLDTI